MHDSSPEMDPHATSAQPLDVDTLRAALRDRRLGNPLLYFSTLGSTNSYAAERAREGAAEGTLVMADDQTAGRGRIGRSWRSLPGEQLALSLVLRPTFPPHFLVMASALAVAETIERVSGLATGIKWPNDVQVNGRKVCGILIETSPGFAILGIGLNVNGSLADDPVLEARATTLADALGRPLSREVIAVELLHRLDDLYGVLLMRGDDGRRGVRDAWRQRLVTLGQRVSLMQGEQRVTGVAEDVDADGVLLLRRDDGEIQPVTWGDVES